MVVLNEYSVHIQDLYWIYHVPREIISNNARGSRHVYLYLRVSVYARG